MGSWISLQVAQEVVVSQRPVIGVIDDVMGGADGIPAP